MIKNSFTHVGSDGTFQGYAALFNEAYPDGTVIAPGAFAESLEKGRGTPKMLLHHDDERPIGKWLLVAEDDRGLFVRGQLDMATEDGRETASLMRSGALDGLSPGYVEVDADGNTVTKIDLWEISIVTFPAMKEAHVDKDTVNFTDAVELDGVHKTKDGYVAAFARVARTGVQLYRGVELGRPDMDVVRVLRPESEVFHPDTIRSFAHRPLTNDHPPVLVNAQNWKKYSVGQTGGDVLRDGQYVRVPVLMMDSEAIKDYDAGKKQLSSGYVANVEWKSGIHDGEPYDAIQRNIRANHLAVVIAARGGSMLRIGDSKEKETTMSDVKLKTVIIDGVTVETTDLAAQLFDREISKLQKQVADAATVAAEKDTKVSSLEKQLAEVQTSSKTALDAATVEITTLKKLADESKITPQKLDQMVKDRAEVVTKAKHIVGDTLVVDGKDLTDIRRQVVAHRMGDVAKDWNDEQVRVSFDTIVADVKADAGLQFEAALADSSLRSGSQTKLTDAYAKRDADLSNAWKGQAH